MINSDSHGQMPGLLKQEVMSLFGPVAMVPTQEPASKCGWFKSLIDNDGGGARSHSGGSGQLGQNEQNQVQSSSWPQTSADPKSGSGDFT